MPSRQRHLSPPSTVVPDVYPPVLPPPPSSSDHHHLLPPVLASTASVFSFFLFFLLCFRRLATTTKRTAPSSDSDESRPPHRFSYSLLRRATSSFSTRLGHGGFGPVFSGALPPPSRRPIAVKVMDSASSLQGEREFHNELFFASRLRSPQHVVSAIGFSADRRRRRFLLVYELMQNGNLQDALLHRKCPELSDWEKRFSVVVDIARAIQYLHSCDPPVIHGDIKPSNILLDRHLSARIGDFGLARLKSESESQLGVGVLGVEELESNGGGELVEETHSVVTDPEQSPEGFVGIPISETSPETIEAAKKAAAAASPNFDIKNVKGMERTSVMSSVTTVAEGLVIRPALINTPAIMKSNSVKDWWWKQDNNEAASSSSPYENKKVKDYVMEWLGKEINKEKPKSEYAIEKTEEKKKKKSKRRLEWWASMDDEEDNSSKVLKKKKEKRRPAREWWKEEYCEELAKKKKKKKKKQHRNGVTSDNEDWWAREEEEVPKSGELLRARRNSHDSTLSGEIPKSGGISSTPSMRGTVCYVAPEYGYGEDVSEKCDVYSFGVLLLVIISGRRPLQVTASPLSEFHRANLLSWARHCARNGKLLDLVDPSIKSLDKEQALLCITIALLCLLKAPSRRPSMKEVVGMLSGELEPPPQLPVEYSPSPPSRFPFKSQRKGRLPSRPSIHHFVQLL
ncbi:receptor-like serine/threonine-protein kinase [Senna tora]|uniref:Receptor-like serine/threonine-protein kinase n=1 Tax=Senna tora TaxID=362788 RepID=A0A834WDP4_9FABA|nr:receptor-like serine/threonine-protein kinase [Senna tora]